MYPGAKSYVSDLWKGKKPKGIMWTGFHGQLRHSRWCLLGHSRELDPPAHTNPYDLLLRLKMVDHQISGRVWWPWFPAFFSSKPWNQIPWNSPFWSIVWSNKCEKKNNMTLFTRIKTPSSQSHSILHGFMALHMSKAIWIPIEIHPNHWAMTCTWPLLRRLQDQHLPAKVEIQNVQILRGWIYVLKHVRTVYAIRHNTTVLWY